MKNMIKFKDVSIDEFIKAVEKLPSDKPSIPYEGGFTTHKEQWIRWLQKYDKKRNARFVYTHLAYPEMMFWLIQSAGVEKRLVKAAKVDSNKVDSMNAKCGAIRKHIPWELLERALWRLA